MIKNKNNSLFHFTQGTPARVVLQVMGLSMLTYSITTFVIAGDLIGFIRGILFFFAGCVIFLLREHVSNSDYFKEFSKYAEENLIFSEKQEEPDTAEECEDMYA